MTHNRTKDYDELKRKYYEEVKQEQEKERREREEEHRKHGTEFLKPIEEATPIEKVKQLFSKDIFTGAPKKTPVTQLTLTFLGAAQTVTGSKYLVESGNTKILVDCGLFQGLKELRLRNWADLPFHPKNIDAVVLTHAHLDHSGYVPLLVKHGFRGKIYCSKATFDLCKILLPDSGYLQEEEARYAQKKGFSKHKNPKPLYTQKEATDSLKYFVPVNYKSEIKISNDMSFEITPIGHILGAGSVKLKAEGKTILFSGDVGRPKSPIMKDPEKVAEADYILVESTYGDRQHQKTDPMLELQKIINATARRGGTIVIPAFAVGRSQKLLYYILQLKKHGQIPNVPIFLDSPMSIKVTNLLDDYANEHKLSQQECLEMYEDTKFTVTAKQSKAIKEFKYPSIVISASGMATGGRVLHHIAYYAPNHNNTILFTGYQAMGTRGRTIVDGKKEVKIHGKMVPIKAEVDILHNMSAHADAGELIDWLKGFKKPPKKVFVIHGEPEATVAFEQRIKNELKWETNIPKYLQQEKL